MFNSLLFLINNDNLTFDVSFSAEKKYNQWKHNTFRIKCLFIVFFFTHKTHLHSIDLCNKIWEVLLYFFFDCRCLNEISASRSAISHCKSRRLSTCFTLFGLARSSDCNFTKKFFVDAQTRGLSADDSTATKCNEWNWKKYWIFVKCKFNFTFFYEIMNSVHFVLLVSHRGENMLYRRC